MKSTATRRPPLTAKRVRGLAVLRQHIDRRRADARCCGELFAIGRTATDRQAVRAALDYIDSIIEWNEGRKEAAA